MSISYLTTNNSFDLFSNSITTSQLNATQISATNLSTSSSIPFTNVTSSLINVTNSTAVPGITCNITYNIDVSGICHLVFNQTANVALSANTQSFYVQLPTGTLPKAKLTGNDIRFSSHAYTGGPSLGNGYVRDVYIFIDTDQSRITFFLTPIFTVGGGSTTVANTTTDVVPFSDVFTQQITIYSWSVSYPVDFS